MPNTLDKKFSGDGGNEQRVLIKDSIIGWKVIMADPNGHLSDGVIQYDYVETLGQKLGGQVKRVLDNYLDKWDHINKDNRDFEDAVICELDASWGSKVRQNMWRSAKTRRY